MTSRREFIIRTTALCGVALIGSPTIPAEAYFPLPGGLTSASLRGIADECRAAIKRQSPRIVNGFDRMPYIVDQLTMQADIFDRMATCARPFEELEAELYARERAIQQKHNYFPA